MKRVYAEVTVKVRIHYDSPAALMEAVRSLREDFGGQSLMSTKFSWECLKKEPIVEVLP